MQFTHGWQWRDVPGADQRFTEEMCTSRHLTLAHLRAMLKLSGSDYALGWGSGKELEYDPAWFTMADMAVARMPKKTMLCSLTGQDLIELHDRWVCKDEMTVMPAYVPADMDPAKVYKIVMYPGMAWQMKAREKNLDALQPGPDIRAEDIWREILVSGE